MTINLKTREAYLRELRGQLGQWSSALDNMEREMQEVPPDEVPAEMRDLLAQLRRQQRNVAKEINDIEALADDQNWLNFKPTADAATHAFARIYSHAILVWPPD